MEFNYIQDNPKRYTFERPNLKKWVESRCKGKVLNLFAGRTRLDIDEVRVDNDEKADVDYLMDALEFLNTTNETFDTIILDPPYKMKNVRVKYRQGHEIEIEIYKNVIKDSNILNDGGIVISIGQDTIGMGRQRSFTKKEICIVSHKAGHDDILVLIEQNNTKKLDSFF